MLNRLAESSDSRSVLSGVACLKFNVRNCGDVVNAFTKNTQKDHIPIA